MPNVAMNSYKLHRGRHCFPSFVGPLLLLETKVGMRRMRTRTKIREPGLQETTGSDTGSQNCAKSILEVETQRANRPRICTPGRSSPYRLPLLFDTVKREVRYSTRLHKSTRRTGRFDARFS